MDTYNPDRPYIVGQQWPPLLADQVLLDPTIEVGYRFHAGPNPTDTAVRSAQLYLPVVAGQPNRKQLTANLYDDGEPALTGPARTVLIPCTAGQAVASASAGGGAANPQAAVMNPSDAAHVVLTGPNAALRLSFGTTAADVRAKLAYHRILDVAVVYAVSGPFDQYPGAVTIGLDRASASLNWIMDDTVTGPPSATASTQIRRARLGELNPWWSPTQTPAQTSWRMPWVPFGRADADTPMTGLDSLAANAGTTVRIGTAATLPPGAVFQVHYIALDVTYGQENRVGAGGLDISAGIGLLADGTSYCDIPLAEVAVNVGMLTRLTPSSPYAVTIGQAYSGSLSVASPVPVVVDRLGADRPFRGLQGIEVHKTVRPGAAPALELTEMMPPIAVVRSDGSVDPGSHVYRAAVIGTCQISYLPGSVRQRLIDTDAGTYSWVRFYARCQPSTRHPLSVGRLAPPGDPNARFVETASITRTDFEASPDLGNGWREVLLRLDRPIDLTGGGAPVEIGFDSDADAASPWHILGADQNATAVAAAAANIATYEGEAGYGQPNVLDLSSDLTVMLLRDMDPVEGFQVTAAVQPLVAADPACTATGDPTPTGIHHHRLQWQPVNSEMVAGWGHYEIQRRDDTMHAGEWETIAHVGSPQIATVDDYEARVGVPTTYRIRTVHRSGLAGPWTDAEPMTIPAPGVTGLPAAAGVLIFTSNYRPEANAAYLMTWDGGTPSEEFTFGEAGEVEWRDHYGRDYRTAHRPLERGGVEFTRTVLVNAVAVAPAVLDRGFRALRDLAWDTLPYVCVRDEAASRWLAAIVVPSATVRRRPSGAQLQLAQLTIAETTATPAPMTGGEPPCEGLRGDMVGAGASMTTTPATWQSIVARDAFGRQRTDGGWGPMDLPPLVWQRASGRADRASVDGAAGRLIIADTRNTNPFFATAVTSWTASGGTFTWQRTQVFEGPGAGLLTPDGAAVTARVDSSIADGVTAGETWRAAARVRCPVARTTTIGITWYDAAGVLLSTTTAAAVTLTANTWTRLAVTGTAPATAARASMNVAMPSTPAATHLLYVDEAYLSPTPAELRMVTPSPVGPADIAVRAKVRITAAPAGTALRAAVIARRVDGSNFYRGNLIFRTDGALTVNIERIVGASATMSTREDPVLGIGSGGLSEPINWQVGVWYWLSLRAAGEVLQVGAWQDGTRPSLVLDSVIDATFADAGRLGVAAGPADANSTNVEAAVHVDTFESVRSPSGLDVRMQFRPIGDDPWTVVAQHIGTFGTNSISSSWYLSAASDRVTASITSHGIVVHDAPATDVGVTTGQLQWLRWVYSTRGDTPGQARSDLYRSLDGVTWTLASTAAVVAEAVPADWGMLRVSVDGPVTLLRASVADEFGTILADPDFTAHPPGTREFTDPASNTWTVAGRGICAG